MLTITLKNKRSPTFLGEFRMNFENCKFILDITSNFAYISLSGILYKVFYKENVNINRSILQAADLVIKSNGVVVKCRFERNNPYLLDCVNRIRSLEELPELQLESHVSIADFIKEKKKAFYEIQKFLMLTHTI